MNIMADLIRGRNMNIMAISYKREEHEYHGGYLMRGRNLNIMADIL